MTSTSTPALSVSKNGESIKTCALEGEVWIGREEGCDIRLDDRAVSRKHAVFRMVGNDIEVEKKSDFAPLLVNGIECSKMLLKNGDHITVGPYTIQVQTTAAPKTETSTNPIQDAHSPPAPEELPLMQSQPEFDPGAPQEINDSIPMGGSDVNFEANAVDEDGKTTFTAPARLLVKLIFKPGTANRDECVVSEKGIVVGRGSDCDVVLKDKKASRKNALIKRTGLKFFIKDLGSSNGTFVNGTKVYEHELSGDDVIRIGTTEFQLKALNAEYAEEEKNFLSVPVDEDAGSVLDSSGFSPNTPADPGAISVHNPNLNPSGFDLGSGTNPEMGSVPGIAGISTSAKKGTLREKFLALPKRTRIIFTVVAALGAFTLFFDEEEPVPSKKKPTMAEKSATAKKESEKGSASFESLSEEQKRFVENQHSLAFDYFKNKEYDKSLFEIQKIFPLVSNYKQAREIERYAKEGKRSLEAREEEQRKKANEEQLKLKIVQAVEDAKAYMSKRQYDQAKEMFSEILAIDPENASVAEWRKEIEAYEESLRQLSQQREAQIEINKHGWKGYKDAAALKKKGRYHSAIKEVEEILNIGVTEPKLLKLLKQVSTQSRNLIKSKRDPILQEAKQAEEANDFSRAFSLYSKATKIDPPHPAGHAGMNRIKGILHDAAKGFYTEAILAESYSDFATARRLFKKCLEIAPPDDIYHERAARKLARYFGNDEMYGHDASQPPQGYSDQGDYQTQGQEDGNSPAQE